MGIWLEMYSILWIVVFVILMVVPKNTRRRFNDYIQKRVCLEIITNIIFWGSVGVCFIRYFTK